MVDGEERNAYKYGARVLGQLDAHCILSYLTMLTPRNSDSQAFCSETEVNFSTGTEQMRKSARALTSRLCLYARFALWQWQRMTLKSLD